MSNSELVYSTETAEVSPFDPQGHLATPYDLEPFGPHYGCVHSIGYCAHWED